jgi:predicted DNA helicase
MYLLCDFPDAPGNANFALPAQRTVTSVIAEGCKAGFLPLQSQAVWARPLLALAEGGEAGVWPIIEWLLRKCALQQGPLFPSVWIAVLTGKAVLPPGVHLALWRAQSSFSFLVDTPLLGDVRKLLALYLGRIPTPAYWLAEAAAHAVHMLIVPNLSVVPAMCRFFSERISGDPVLVRAVLDGMLELLQSQQLPPRRLLALILRAWNLVFASGVALKLSLTKVCNALVTFIAGLDAEPNLTEATGKVLKDCLLAVSRLCTQDARVAVAGSQLPSLLRGAGLPAHAVQQVMAALKPIPVVDLVGAPAAVAEVPLQRRRLPPSFSAAAPRDMGAPGEAKKRRVEESLVSEEVRSEIGLARAFPTTYFTGHQQHSAPMLTPQQIRERQEFAAAKPTKSSSGAARPRVRLQPAPRKKVQPLMSTSPGLGARALSAQERELRNRQRLLPSRNALLKYVLGWTLADLVSDKGDPSLILKEVPDHFSSVEQYVSVFEPLLLAEMRAVLQKDAEENEGEPALEMKLGNVGRKDPFRLLTLRLATEQGQVAPARNAMRDRWSVDDVIEMRPSSEAAEGAAADGMLAIVTKIEYLPKERLEEVHVTVAPRDVGNVNWVPLWMCRAISSVVTSSREHRAMMSLNSNLPLQEYVLTGGRKAGTVQPSLPVPKMLHQRFNESQTSAIVKCLQQPHGFTLIQGPPGTGKTLTILGIVGSLLMSHRHERSGERVLRKRILLCAASNKAVDEVTSRLLSGIWDPFRDRSEELAVVRVGREEAMSESVRGVTLERLAAARCASHTQRHEESVQSSQAKIKELEARMADCDKRIAELEAAQVGVVSLRNSSEDAAATGSKETELAQKIRDLYQIKSETRQILKRTRDSCTKAIGDKKADLAAAREDVVRCADVVCCTLSGAGSDLLIKCDLEFDAVIIDEATQATELHALIPLKYRSKLCVLVGDPKQLPATVMSRDAAACSFRQSLFQRLQRLGVPVSMLRMQYRMHPAISAFPNAEFYEGQLVDGPKVRVRKPYHDHPLFGPFLFIDVKGVEERHGGHSAMNVAEATLTAALTRTLMAQFGAQVAGGVAVITPYKRQMHLLTQMIGSTLPSSQKALIEINTIDGFQGCEKDVVLFSCVRSHEGSSIGFLDDVRRLNVAITRARFALVVLGDAQLLSKHPTFASLIGYAQRTGCFTSAIDAERGLSGMRSMDSTSGGRQGVEAAPPHPQTGAKSRVKSAAEPVVSSSDARLRPAEKRVPAAPPKPFIPVKPAPSPADEHTPPPPKPFVPAKIAPPTKVKVAGDNARSAGRPSNTAQQDAKQSASDAGAMSFLPAKFEGKSFAPTNKDSGVKTPGGARGGIKRGVDELEPANAPRPILPPAHSALPRVAAGDGVHVVKRTAEKRVLKQPGGATDRPSIYVPVPRSSDPRPSGDGNDSSKKRSKIIVLE